MARTLAVLFALGLAHAAHAHAAPDPPVSQADALTEVRAELAQLKLAVMEMKAEREELIEFLKQHRDGNIDKQLAEWRAERAKLAEERRLLRVERQRLEKARRALHQQTVRNAQHDADEQGKAAKEKTDALKPKWSAQYMIGLIDKASVEPTVYVRAGRDVLVAAERVGNVDRRNVMVRGTLLNQSLASWRYTFEINIGGPADPLTRKVLHVGQWRYQTPLLGPGELHTFEVKVPVTDVRDIASVQIAKVSPDRPAPTPPPPAPVGEPAEGSAATEVVSE